MLQGIITFLFIWLGFSLSILYSLSPQLIFPFKREMYVFDSYNNIQNAEQTKVIGYVLSKSKATLNSERSVSHRYDSRKDILTVKVYDIHDLYVGDEVYILKERYQDIEKTHSLIISKAKVSVITRNYNGIYILRLKGFFAMVAPFSTVVVPLIGTKRNESFLYYKEGDSFYSRGDISAAIMAFHKSLEEYPQQVESHLSLSKIYQENDFLEQSKNHIRVAWKYRYRVKDSNIILKLLTLYLRIHIGENQDYIDSKMTITFSRITELLRVYQDVDEIIHFLEEKVKLSEENNHLKISFLNMNFYLGKYYTQLYIFFERSLFQKKELLDFLSNEEIQLDKIQLYKLQKYKKNFINQKFLNKQLLKKSLFYGKRPSLIWEETFFQAALSQFQNLLTYESNPDHLDILYNLIKLLEKYLERHSVVYSLSQKPFFELMKKYMQEYLDKTSILDARRNQISQMLLDYDVMQENY